MKLASPLLCLLLIVLAAFAFSGTEAKLREGECEVCLKVIGQAQQKLIESKAKTPEAVEDILRKLCQTEVKNKQDQRLCYYIGGTADSATSLLREISRPLLNGLPTEKICERLKKKDAEVCSLSYPQQLDLSSADLSKLRVKQLKNIIAGWGEKCRGCSSKQDYIDLINAKRHLHSNKVDL